MTVGEGVRQDLAGEPASVSVARRFVRQVLEEAGLDGAIEVATLLTSELATNAVLHARTAFAVRVDRVGQDVRVEVLDGSPVQPRLRRSSGTAATGRGVAMMARLSTGWGTTPPERLGGYAKGVWFTVAGDAAYEQVWDLELIEGL